MGEVGMQWQAEFESAYTPGHPLPDVFEMTHQWLTDDGTIEERTGTWRRGSGWGGEYVVRFSPDIGVAAQAMAREAARLCEQRMREGRCHKCGAIRTHAAGCDEP